MQKALVSSYSLVVFLTYPTDKNNLSKSKTKESWQIERMAFVLLLTKDIYWDSLYVKSISAKVKEMREFWIF